MKPRPAAMVGLLVTVLALAIRLPGLGDILTADEPQWVFRAQSFYTALHRGDPGGTFQGTHPGVVPMLLIGAGIEVRQWLTGENPESPNVGAFRTAAKFPIALVVSGGIGLAAAFVVQLWGIRAGLISGVLLALEPFFAGHSQLAHVDALLAILMPLALLAFLWYLRERQRRLLALSSLLTGLALLTKIPAIVLIPAVGTGMVIAVRPLPRAVRTFVFWSIGAALTILLLWPSMWLTTDFYAGYITRDVRAVATTSHIGAEIAEATPQSLWFYIRALASRTSPLTLLTGAAGIILLLRARQSEVRTQGMIFAMTLGGLFLLLNFVEKRADRYLLPALSLLAILAGISLSQLSRGSRLVRTAVVLSVGMLAFANLQLQPYALAFATPFGGREELSQTGWGEGLEQAAALLNTHPLATELQVATWYPAVFKEFFHGLSMSLSSRDDARVDYVVLYRNMYGRGADHPATAIAKEFRDEEPVATIRVLGKDVAWIYARESVDRFPKHVGEIVRPGAAARGTGNAPTAQEVGQMITADRDGLSGVRLVFATFSSRSNRGELLLHVRENPDGADLRTVRVDMRRLKDNAWKEIRFEPLPNSKGVTYYVALTSPSGEPGNAVTARYQPNDILPGRLVVLRRPLRSGEKRAAYLGEGDLAYALVYQGDASHAD